MPAASPVRTATAGVPLAISSRARAAIATLSICAASAGLDQLTDSSRAALKAAQVPVATTATALPRLTTASVPAGCDGVDWTVPPRTGLCLMTA